MAGFFKIAQLILITFYNISNCYSNSNNSSNSLNFESYWTPFSENYPLH